MTALPNGIFARLSNLEGMNLADNQLTDLPLGIFNGLDRLISLTLGITEQPSFVCDPAPDCYGDLTRGNPLRSLPSAIFDGLGELESLSLEYLEFTTLPAGVFAGLGNLRTLDLANGRLQRLPIGVFDGLVNLASLDLSYNHLTELPAGLFGGLDNLEWLTVNGNPLATLPAGLFDRLPNLETLRLDYNDFTSLPPNLFRGAGNLRELHLNGNPLTSLASGLFSEAHNLLELQLRDNDLTSLPSDLFSGLDSLCCLYLDHNNLASLPVGLLDGLSNLTSLSLANNPLTSLPIGLFEGLQNLHSVHLDGTEIAAPLPERLFAGPANLMRFIVDRFDEQHHPYLLVRLIHDQASHEVIAWVTTYAPIKLRVFLKSSNATLSPSFVDVASGNAVSDPVTIEPFTYAPPVVSISSVYVLGANYYYDFDFHLLNDGVEPDSSPSFQETTISSQTFIVNEEVAPIVLPEADGGNGQSEYRLQWAHGRLPNGLNFNPRTRTLSGTPIEARIYTMSYLARDVDGDIDELKFEVRVTPTLDPWARHLILR